MNKAENKATPVMENILIKKSLDNFRMIKIKNGLKNMKWIQKKVHK